MQNLLLAEMRLNFTHKLSDLLQSKPFLPDNNFAVHVDNSSHKLQLRARERAKPLDDPINVFRVSSKKLFSPPLQPLGIVSGTNFVAVASRKKFKFAFDRLESFGDGQINEYIRVERPIGV